MTIALAVNSAGDCVAGTYGWNAVESGNDVGCRAVVAIRRDINMRFLLQSAAGL
jgi:hypothetical protein